MRGSALSALQGTNEELGKKAILKLMDAVDEYISDPVRKLDKPFLMPIEDVFSIQVSKKITTHVKQNIISSLGTLFFFSFFSRGVELLSLVVLNKAPSKWERRLKYWD